MNLQKIEILIRKYESGETSMEEEKHLYDYFLQNEVPPHLANYKKLFSYYRLSKNELLKNDEFDDILLEKLEQSNPSLKSYKRYRMLSIAASILILIGIGIYFQANNSRIQYVDTYNNPKMAYAETKRILLLVSGNINTGASELQNVTHLEEGFKKLHNISTLKSGMRKMEKLSVLTKSKNLITSKK